MQHRLDGEGRPLITETEERDAITSETTEPKLFSVVEFSEGEELYDEYEIRDIQYENDCVEDGDASVTQNLPRLLYVCAKPATAGSPASAASLTGSSPGFGLYPHPLQSIPVNS